MPDQHSWLAISASHRSEFHVDFLFSRLVFAFLEFLAFRLFRAVGENARCHRENRRQQREQQQQLGDYRHPRNAETPNVRGPCAVSPCRRPLGPAIRKLFPELRTACRIFFGRQA